MTLVGTGGALPKAHSFCSRLRLAQSATGCSRSFPSQAARVGGSSASNAREATPPCPAIPPQMSVPQQLQASGRGQEGAGAMGGGSSD